MRSLTLLFILLPFCQSQCPHGLFNHTGECCKMCPPGTYVKEPCTKDIPTECAECIEDTYSDQPTQDSACKRCTQCSGGRQETQSCTKERNRVCECPYEQYFNLAVLFCFDCSVCEEGEGTDTPCRGTNNSVCADCIQDVSFSSSKSHLEACQPCTKCMGATLTPCTLTSDTVCAFINTAISRPPATLPVAQPSIKATKSSKSEENELYVITGVIVGVVIVVLVIIVICWQIQRRRKTERTPASSEAGRDPDNISTEGGEGVKMARDLPGHVIMEIEERLNPDGPNNWVKLADRLGATQLDISNYKLVPEKATQKVIQGWCIRESATVNELCKALKEIKRPDCVAIVKPYSSIGKSP